MALLSEIPDDDNGKKPQELEKNPEEDEGAENQNEKAEEEEVVNPKNCFETLPEEAIELCIARVSKCDYPAISITSTAFRRLIASPQLYVTRSQNGVAEHFLYTLISSPPDNFPEWYILYQSSQDISPRLHRVTSLPAMPFASAVVTVGQEIYVLGGHDGERVLSDVLLIDCRTHKCYRSLPRMKVARRGAAAGVIDGKIYVIGGCKKRDSNWIEVFNLKTKVWSAVTGTMNSNVGVKFLTYAVMEENIYAMNAFHWHVFDHKKTECSSWVDGDLWKEPSCVIDDMLYTIDPESYPEKPILIYKPKEKVWRFLNLGDSIDSMPPELYYEESEMTNFGGKLVILASNRRWSSIREGEKQIWCFKIALERHRGEIRGTVESADVVFRTTESSPSIHLCRTVTF